MFNTPRAGELDHLSCLSLNAFISPVWLRNNAGTYAGQLLEPVLKPCPRVFLGYEPISRLMPLALFLPLACTEVHSSEVDNGLPRATYHFSLTKNREPDVCGAYLTRLNSTSFKKQPQCDIPESDATAGFTKLNRIPLTADEVVALFPRVYWFRRAQNQNWNGQYGGESLVRNSVGSSIVAWTYSPAISLRNDGTDDNIVVWQGFGAMPGIMECGEPTSQGDSLVRSASAQMALVINDQGAIDEGKTRAYFSAPSDAKASTNQESGFEEIGWSVGIFKYRGTYYTETFAGSSFGFVNLERNQPPPKTDTLRVFHRKGDSTSLACELTMTTKLHFQK